MMKIHLHRDGKWIEFTVDLNSVRAGEGATVCLDSPASQAIGAAEIAQFCSAEVYGDKLRVGPRP